VKLLSASFYTFFVLLSSSYIFLFSSMFIQMPIPLPRKVFLFPSPFFFFISPTLKLYSILPISISTLALSYRPTWPKKMRWNLAIRIPFPPSRPSHSLDALNTGETWGGWCSLE
jgi:hypothetical protein